MILSDMARFPRFDLAGVPQHVVQRGNNRLPCFLDDEDRQRYLQCLRQALKRVSGTISHKKTGPGPLTVV
jgi:REP-associated tyrosine transposase